MRVLGIESSCDDPYGFAFDDDGVWASSLILGGRF